MKDGKKVRPLTIHERTSRYTKQRGTGFLTPAQQRRIRHKHGKLLAEARGQVS